MARKKKSGAAKNKEKQKAHQSKVQAGAAGNVELTKLPANAEMKCDKCERAQKNRAFCYFCGTLQRLPQCVHCGRQKCMSMGGGDCCVKHIGSSATGMAFIGAICDFCEGWVCHSRRCLQKHSCPCPLDGAACIECTRTIANNGGRFFQCGTCHGWLCEDDQFEHQASCTVLQTEKYQCGSCNRFGTWSCLKCKVCFCDTHRAGNIPQPKGEPPKCKKCQNPLSVTKDLSISTKSHKYGRGSQARVKKTVDEDGGGAAAAAAAGAGAGAGADGKGSDGESDADRDDSDRYAAFMNQKNTGTHDYLNLARDLAPDNKSAANRWQNASYSDDEDSDAHANAKRMDGDDDDGDDGDEGDEGDEGEGDDDDDDDDGEGEGDDDADADGDAADQKTAKPAAAAAAGASAKAAAGAGAGAAKPKAGAKADAKHQPAAAPGKPPAADAKAKFAPAPVPAAAAAPKAAAPKAAAVPLESLPPTAMSLDATKKLLFSRKPFNPDFWKSFWPTFDAAGWSFHTAVYAYDSENSLLFKTNNLVSGWLQRSDECRRYALGVVHVSGADEDTGPFHVASCWLFRGADVIPQMLAVDDAAYFTWTKVDVSSAAGKALVEAHFTGPKPPNSSGNAKLTLLDRRYLK